MLHGTFVMLKIIFYLVENQISELENNENLLKCFHFFEVQSWLLCLCKGLCKICSEDGLIKLNGNDIRLYVSQVNLNFFIFAVRKDRVHWVIKHTMS